MSDTLSLDIQASIQWLFEETLDLSTVSDHSKVDFLRSVSDGTADGQADKIWHDIRTVASGANDDLDLTSLSQTIHSSVITINLAKVKALFIVNTATAAGERLYLDSSVAGALLGPFNGNATSRIEVPADSPLLLTNLIAGWAVANGTSDVLRVTNDGTGNIDYKIVIVGTSA